MTGKNKPRAPSVGGSPKLKPPKEDCSSLSDSTSIASPNPDMLATLRVGMMLTVELQPSPQVVVVKNGSAVVGGLAPVQLVRLIACLKAGYQFSATVTRRDGGFCEVHVTCTGRP